MSRRRLFEILFAAALLVALIAIILVRPTAKQTGRPTLALFRRASIATEGFDGTYEARIVPSPDSTRAAVLYPVEFEERADLYLLPTHRGSWRLTLVDSLRAENTPKNVGWLDARTLWVTIGYVYGTVSPGGDLYAVSPETGHAVLLWGMDADDRVQARTLERAGADWRIRLTAFDRNLDHPRDSSAVLTAAVVEAATRALAKD